MKFRWIILLFVFFATLIGCKKETEYSIIPYIELISFEKQNSNGIDLKGLVKFKFTDQDGDIGLKDQDTVYPYNFNLFITYYKKTNGEWLEYEFQDTTIPPHGRIPYLTPKGQNKTIRGEIEFEFYINDLNTTVAFDTMRFDIFIKDRALHNSNTIQINDVVVKKR